MFSIEGSCPKLESLIRVYLFIVEKKNWIKYNHASGIIWKLDCTCGRQLEDENLKRLKSNSTKRICLLEIQGIFGSYRSFPTVIRNLRK